MVIPHGVCLSEVPLTVTMVVPHGVCLSEVPLTVVVSKNSLLAMHAVCQRFFVAIESC